MLKNQKAPQHIIISRTDNIGDVVLTLPLAYSLKQKFPGVFISFLGRPYVEAVVRACPFVDQWLAWDANTKQLPAADVIIHAFPVKKIAILAKKAGIRWRIGTSHRWYHWLYCNQRVHFSRVKSLTHEALLNYALLKFFTIACPSFTELQQMAALCFARTRLQQDPTIQSFLDPTRFNLVIHPLSNGHGREWPLASFQQLIRRLDKTKINILITGSPAEHNGIHEGLSKHCENITDLSGKLSLSQLLTLISTCDGLLAASTGPLHLAASLNIPTLGLFAPKSLISPARWAPVGPKAEWLVLDQPCKKPCHNQTCACLAAIGVDQVAQKIQSWTGP